MLHRRRDLNGRTDDQGIALFVVVAAMAVITLFLTTSLYVVLSNAEPSRSSQDAKAAYAAAEAGVDEYLARLNATSGNYWVAGNTDTTNPALTTSGPGQQVQGTNGSGARFRYQLLNPGVIARDGKIRLQVTGVSAPGQTGTTGVTKTITATLVPSGFVKYVYFSDVEVLDPALMSAQVLFVNLNGSSSPGANRKYAMTKDDACSLRYYEGRSSAGFTLTGPTPAVGVWNTSTSAWSSAPGAITAGQVTGIACTEIQWTGGDTVRGALHSNDALQIGGAVTFTDPKTESSWPLCQTNPAANCWWNSGVPATNRPRYGAPMSLPVSNQSLRTIATDTTANVGCYYTGATRITFNGTQMTVYSPNTTSAPARCLNVANRANPQIITTIPQVIYVDQVAGGCVGAGYPVANESTTVGVTTDYTCNRGTALVQGTVNGQVTIAGLDDIVVTGDLTYTNGTNGNDVVGLVAGNNVWVYHPVRADGTNLLAAANNVYNIQAAVLALRHSFIVQNWNLGSAMSTGSAATKLNITGSLAQKFRGPVGTGNGVTATTGYLKNYVYDSRLLNVQPPYFLQPVASPWSVETLTDR